jgi:hypothetical protein
MRTWKLWALAAVLSFAALGVPTGEAQYGYYDDYYDDYYDPYYDAYDPYYDPYYSSEVYYDEWYYEEYYYDYGPPVYHYYEGYELAPFYYAPRSFIGGIGCG